MRPAPVPEDSVSIKQMAGDLTFLSDSKQSPPNARVAVAEKAAARESKRTRASGKLAVEMAPVAEARSPVPVAAGAATVTGSNSTPAIDIAPPAQFAAADTTAESKSSETNSNSSTPPVSRTETESKEP